MKKPTTTFRISGADFVQTVAGQKSRTLNALVDAGHEGITALEVSTWALRLAHYVLKLKRRGLSIETLREDHSGPGGKGWHGRYRLQSVVEIIKTPEVSRVAASKAASETVIVRWAGKEGDMLGKIVTSVALPEVTS